MRTVYADQIYTGSLNTTTGADIKIHKFQLAGLGRAPFTFINIIERTYCPCPGVASQPSGTCAYCGNGIKYCCVIQDADGKTFEVGNECVKKTDDAGMIKIITNKLKIAMAQKRREAAEIKRRAKFEADRARVEAARVILQDSAVVASLSAQIHPVESRAKLGDTLLNYVNWLLENADIGGQVRAAFYIENAAEASHN